ncbi:facilitated trehalose transporter Tret1-like isoform X2 [Plodia interpunctella]|uniref:facilitated trehalose transporter Tret1-like isoform X2 n=1 Tax=Plodia interpunctella TaxID=58824 RepID=UPI002367AC43|nr:facilitated trehalose transporter Tret1-like isoform X2 [Plodia interpunctella]
MSVKEHGDLGSQTQYGYEKDFRTALPQFIAVSVKNLLLLGYGMTLGFPTILIPAVKNPAESEVLQLTNSQVSWISSLNLIVVPLGCALSGVVTAPMGRRRAMQVVNLPFFVAWLLFHFSSTTEHLYGALILTGLAGGILEAPVLTYVAEITQPHLRGALTATSSMCIIIGVFTQFLFGLFMYWRTVALVNIIFTVLAVMALFFVPESPHWLVSRKRFSDAKKSLQWLRGWTEAYAVEDELKNIQALYISKKDKPEDEESFTEKISNYTKKGFILPFLLVSYSFFVGHFCGMTTLQICGTIICVLLVHYTGKRPLTLFSTGAAGVCALLVAGYDGFLKTHDLTLHSSVNTTNMTTDNLTGPLNNPYSWIPMTLLMLLALISHSGIRLLPWILIGEVFSAKTRSGGAGLASAVGYLFGFLTNKMFLSMVDRFAVWGTYGFYSFVGITGCFAFYFVLPETEGKTLNQIENHYAGITRLTNEVYRSKKRPKKVISSVYETNGTINPSFEPDISKL